MTTFQIDHDGLHRVLSDWSGAGGLYAAISAMTTTEDGREWTRKEIEARAQRILLLDLEPVLRRWPTSTRNWREKLQVESVKIRLRSDSPRTGVDWARTRRSGWPPVSYSVRRRRRSSDEKTLTLLGWVVSEIRSIAGALSCDEIRENAVGASSSILSTTEAALPVLGKFVGANIPCPTVDEIRYVQEIGGVWKHVGIAARILLGHRRIGAEALARRLLHPDGFPEVLFQLSALGSVLNACEALGARATSLRPIGLMAAGPVYRIDWDSLPSWDLWCEAAGAWKTYGIEDTYRDIAEHLTRHDGSPFAARNIRPDILIAVPASSAVVVECKYPGETLSPGYVGSGLYQAAFYAQQLAASFPAMLGVSMGPSELVPETVTRNFGGVELAVSSPSRISDMVNWLRVACSRSSPIPDDRFSERK